MVEAEDLIADAPRAVERYCRHAGIPFVASALSWPPGDQQVWSRTSQWHRDAARSSRFTESRRTYPQTVDNNRFLAGCYRHHLPHYQFLRAWAQATAATTNV